MMKKGYSFIGAYNEANGPNGERYYQEYCGVKTIVISDLFIGNFGVSQIFGANPAMYKKFGWKGHNGIDFRCPTGTQLIACCNGKIIEAYNDGSGWGNHVYIYDASQKAMFIYAHMKTIAVRVGQVVRTGQLLGLSNNTGNSTGPHLHFGGYQTNDSGYKINLGNGYGGAINPFDSKLVTWNVKNPSKPL